MLPCKFAIEESTSIDGKWMWVVLVIFASLGTTLTAPDRYQTTHEDPNRHPTTQAAETTVGTPALTSKRLAQLTMLHTKQHNFAQLLPDKRKPKSRDMDPNFGANVISFSCTVCIKMTTALKNHPNKPEILSKQFEDNYCAKLGILKNICVKAVQSLSKSMEKYGAEKIKNTDVDTFCQDSSVGFCSPDETGGCPLYYFGEQQLNRNDPKWRMHSLNEEL